MMTRRSLFTAHPVVSFDVVVVDRRVHRLSLFESLDDKGKDDLINRTNSI